MEAKSGEAIPDEELILPQHAFLANQQQVSSYTARMPRFQMLPIERPVSCCTKHLSPRLHYRVAAS